MRVRIRDAISGDLTQIMEIERLAFDDKWSPDSFFRGPSPPYRAVYTGWDDSGLFGPFLTPARCLYAYAVNSGILWWRLRLSRFSRTTVATAGSGSNEKVIGYLYRWLGSDEYQVLNVAVHPEARRLGVGERLMREAIAEATIKGTPLVTLEVRQSNLSARALYRKLDFEERQFKHKYNRTGEDSILMELRLK